MYCQVECHCVTDGDKAMHSVKWSVTVSKMEIKVMQCQVECRCVADGDKVKHRVK